MNGPVAASAATAETANLPFRSPQVEPWAGHENYDPTEHTPERTDSLASNSSTVVASGGDPKSTNVLNPKGTTASGTTSTTVAETAKAIEKKNADEDTMKKQCVVDSKNSNKNAGGGGSDIGGDGKTDVERGLTRNRTAQEGL